MKKSYVLCLTALMMSMFMFYGCGGYVGAEIKLSMGKYQDAVPMIEQHLVENPDDVKARGRLGFAYIKTGKIDNAIKELEIVRKQDPEDSYASFYLGLAYLNNKEYAKAVEVWKSYKDKHKPLVEAEIKKLLTVVQIAASRKAAKSAVANESKLMTSEPGANTVAVCYYDDLSPDKELKAFQKGLTAMVITNLSKIKSIKVLERVRVQALLEEMKLGQTGIVDPATAPKIGRLLGAETVVVGNLSKGSINAVTTLASAKEGKTVGSSAVNVDEADFFNLPAAIVMHIADLKKITLTDDEKAAVGEIQTKNLKAFIYYGQALDALDSGDWKKAKDLYAMALKEDPRFKDASDGKDSCPSKDAPSVGELSNMKAKSLAGKVEKIYEQAAGAQRQSDSETGGTGEGGDGDSGGSSY